MANLYVNHTKISLYEFFFSTKTRKTYTNFGISLLLIIVLIAFALRPTILTIGRINEKITKYESINSRIEKKITAAQRLAQQKSFSSEDYSDGLKDEIDFLDLVFFGEPDVKLMYKNLNQRSIQNKVAIKTITPKYVYTNENILLQPDLFDTSPDSPSELFYEVVITFEANEMKDVENFLNALEGSATNPILSRVKNVTIHNGIEENNVKKTNSSLVSTLESNMISGNLTFLIYLDPTKGLISAP